MISSETVKPDPSPDTGFGAEEDQTSQEGEYALVPFCGNTLGAAHEVALT